MPHPPDKPSLLKKIGSFTTASVKHAMDGFSTTPEEIAEERLRICQHCENFDAEGVSCKICGCDLKIKVKWATESCPINKWISINRGYIKDEGQPIQLMGGCGGCSSKS